MLTEWMNEEHLERASWIIISYACKSAHALFTGEREIKREKEREREREKERERERGERERESEKDVEYGYWIYLIAFNNGSFTNLMFF